MLALLRGDTEARPRFDPGLAGGLRAWLEDAAYGVVAARGDDAPAVFLGPRQVLGAPEGRRNDEGPGDELVLSRLVHAVFRQLVGSGTVGDPLADALDALRACGDDVVVRHVEALPAAARDALADTVALHAGNLEDLVPRFAPGWMPRTDDRVAIPLAGGRVVLHGTFDLLVGLPQPGTASLCALGLSASGPWAARASVPPLPRAARDAAQRGTSVPAGAARIGHRPLRRRGCPRGASPGHRLTSLRVVEPRRARPWLTVSPTC